MLFLFFPKDYPLFPPTCIFVTPIFHPNVFVRGEASFSFLGDGWDYTLTIRDILLKIQELLAEPELDHPVHPEAFQLYM